MSLIQQYKVRFFKNTIHGSVYNGINTINPLLDAFLSEDQTFEDVNETIDALSALLNAEITNMNFSGESLITIVADQNTSTIYEVPNYDAKTLSYSLPTVDLKGLVEVWRDYLANG